MASEGKAWLEPCSDPAGFWSGAKHHDKGHGTETLNHTKSSICPNAAVALKGRTMCKGIKTSNSSRARAGHSEALNYFPRHPQPQNVFSKREHWAFVSKQKLKLTVNKTGCIKVKRKKRGEKEGRKKAEERWKVTKREKRGERKRKWPVEKWIMALPCGTFTVNLSS